MEQADIDIAMRQAQALVQAGHAVQAEAIYRHIITTAPRFHPAYQELGLLAFKAGNLQMAADLFQAAIEIDSRIALYFRNLGEISRRLGRFEAAIKAGRVACQLATRDIDAHFNLGLACADAKMSAAAAEAFRTVLALQDEMAQAGQLSAPMWSMRGNVLQKLEKFDEARVCYEHALELQPDYPAVQNALGSLLKTQGLVQEAAECFIKALQADPRFAEARLNLGMAQLYLGDWQAGWENYEARWTGSSEHNNGTFVRPDCPLPQWQGQGESGEQGLLIFAEQGFGDTFQFCRYLELAAQRFARVGFVCPWPGMIALMERSFADLVVVLRHMPADFADWQWHCPLMSLPRAFQTRPDTVPVHIPYLKVPTPARRYWRDRLVRHSVGQFRIGLAWAGRRSHQADARRSIRFEQLLPLMNNERFTWVSLQKQEGRDGVIAVPGHVHWIDWSNELLDFSDTAALTANLDLIISIDSAMVHLAGALGRPVWMLNRFDSEWRWMAHRPDSPWYPDLRIFTQSRLGDWASVIQDVQRDLGAFSV